MIKSVRIGRAASSKAGRLVTIEVVRAFTIDPPIAKICGAFATRLFASSCTPDSIFARPPSMSEPEKIEARPSITVDMDGRNSDIILFLRPESDAWTFCKLSWNCAELAIASSLITAPNSCAC